MLGGMVNQRSNDAATQEVCERAGSVVSMLSRALQIEAEAGGVQKHQINGLTPGDVVYLLDKEKVHIAFVRTGSAMSTFIVAHVPDKIFTTQDAVQIGNQELGHPSISGVSFPKQWLNAGEQEFTQALRDLVRPMISEAKKMVGRPPMPTGYEQYQPLVHRFLDDHSPFERNVFVAMRFSPTTQHEAIWHSIKATLSETDFRAHRADQKIYPDDDDLWSNVVTYMLGCKYAICVFDQIDTRDFNPNVQIEYGFMRALNRRVLLLKDSRQPLMPTDITGKIYQEFDSYRIEETVPGVVSTWTTKYLLGDQ
jgi:hypothetical protein